MKKSTKLFLIAVYVVALVFAVRQVYNAVRVPNPALNPDPNHTHADFAVWINGEHQNFAEWQYMSGKPGTHDNGDAMFEIPEDAVEDWEAVRDENHYLHKHLHLHDGVGHVIHRHKPGLSFKDFLDTIGYTYEDWCITTDQNSTYCDTDATYWRLFINDVEVPLQEDQPLDINYVFEDMDSILLTYNPSEEQLQQQRELMTDDACLFSQTCPWRGPAPAENCVADPEIPCAAPLE